MNRRSLLPCGLVALTLFGGASAPTPAPPGAPFETWRFNARERTARGLAQLATDPKAAAENLAAASRLEPEDPRALLNAGAGWMVAGESQRAVEALEQAARLAADTSESAQPGLAAEAQYQLGTAKLEAGDLEGSIEALRESLRRDPSAEDAKHNLELALRRKQKQDEERRRQQEQQQQEQEQKKDQNQQEQPPEQRPEQRPQDPSQQEPDQPDQREPKPGDGDESQPPQQAPKPKPGERPDDMKNWQPQPDMTQAQAEALLEAVENRERQQRRDEARKRAIKRSREEKDW